MVLPDVVSSAEGLCGPWRASGALAAQPGRPPRTVVVAAGLVAGALGGSAALADGALRTRLGPDGIHLTVLGAPESVLLAEGLVDLEEHLLLALVQRGVGEDHGARLDLVPVALGVEDPGADVQRLGGDAQRLGDLLEHLRAGLAQPALDLAQIRIGHPGGIGELPQRQLRVAPLLTQILTESADVQGCHIPTMTHPANNCKHPACKSALALPAGCATGEGHRFHPRAGPGPRLGGHPSEVVEAGRRITAEVVVVDTCSGQVALSLTGAGRIAVDLHLGAAPSIGGAGRSARYEKGHAWSC